MSIPSKTYLQLDSSILPPNTHKSIIQYLKDVSVKLNNKYKNYFRIKINFFPRATPFLESYKINDENHYLNLLKKSVFETLHSKAIPYFRSSVADENIFGSHGFTVLGIGPEGGNAHAPNEWVSLSSLNKLYIIINNFLQKVDKTI